MMRIASVCVTLSNTLENERLYTLALKGETDITKCYSKHSCKGKVLKDTKLSRLLLDKFFYVDIYIM